MPFEDEARSSSIEEQVYDVKPISQKMKQFEKEEFLNYLTMDKKHQRVFPVEIREQTHEALKQIKRNFTIDLINQPTHLRRKGQSASLTDRLIREDVFKKKEEDEEEELNKSQGPTVYFSPKIADDGTPKSLGQNGDHLSMEIRDSNTNLLIPKLKTMEVVEDEKPNRNAASRFACEEKCSESPGDSDIPDAEELHIDLEEKSGKNSESGEFDQRRFGTDKENINSPVSITRKFEFSHKASQPKLAN